jgi:hypothetical protein
MPLTPPICLRARFLGTGSPTGNDYPVTLTINTSDFQTYTTSGPTQVSYNGTNVAVGMYATNRFDGRIFRIKSISSQTSTQVVCILEDIGGLNAKIDPNGLGNGGVENNQYGYIFELNSDGLPILSQVLDYPTVTYTDSIVGRLVNDKQPPLDENFCVAGGTGTNIIGTTHDGKTWIPRTISFFTNVRGIAWNGTLWVAVGSPGSTSIGYSSDGINWTAGPNLFSGGGRGVAWNGSLWVAVGNGVNKIAYSSDGINWTVASSPFTVTGFGVAWNGALWVAVGQGGNTIATSSDGVLWAGVSGSPFTTLANRVAWNGSLWLAVGGGTNTIAYSTNGIEWTGIGTTIFSTVGYDIHWNGSLWVAVGQGTNTLAYSTTPTTSWTGLGTTLFSSAGRGVTWNGAKWLAVGQGTNSVASSTDGITWVGDGTILFSTSGFCIASRKVLSSTVNSASSTAITPITDNFCVAGGEGIIAYSYDALKWTISNTTLFTNVNGIAWNGSMWVIAGLGAANWIATSSNGITWTGRGNSPFNTGGTRVAWNGTSWLGLGSGSTYNIATSTNGIIWTGRNTGDKLEVTNDVVWIGNRWVVAGQSSDLSFCIIMSNDGITWAKVTTSSVLAFANGVAWSGTVIVAVGAGLYTGADCIASSSDGGFSWTSRGGGTIFDNGASKVAYNGTLWVAVGSGSNSIASSSDGATWFGRGGTDLFPDGGSDIAWNGSLWVAVGYGTYTIATSPDGITWTGRAGTSILGTLGRSVASRLILPNTGKRLTVENGTIVKISDQLVRNPILEFNRGGTTFGGSSISDWKTQVTSSGAHYQIIRANTTDTITPVHIDGTAGWFGINAIGTGTYDSALSTGFQFGKPTTGPYDGTSYNLGSNAAFYSQIGFNVEEAVGRSSHKANLWIYTDLPYNSGTNSAGAIAFGARNEFSGYRVVYGRVSGMRLGNFYGGLSFSTMHNFNDGVLRENVRIQDGNLNVTSGSLFASNTENIQYITSNTTLAIPTGYTKAHITLVGAGGGGGGGQEKNGGGGGGAGWVIEQLFTNLSYPLTVTIGTGGTAGAATPTNGGAGGATTLTYIGLIPGTISAPGGSGGLIATTTSGGNGGAGYYGGGGGGSVSPDTGGTGGTGTILPGTNGAPNGTGGNGGGGGSAANGGAGGLNSTGGGGGGGGPNGGFGGNGFGSLTINGVAGGIGCGGGGGAGVGSTGGAGGNGYAIVRFLR